ncbi:MAG: maleylpyruvate isomerase N-terminal domain-containing protein [Nocardioides sp.]
MRTLTFAHATAVGLLKEQIAAFVDGAESFSEYDLLGASRVHGWSRLDTVVHVRAGLEEMVGVCAAQVDGPPDHDAASYWASFADDDADQVPHILWMRRTASAYTRPSGALRHLTDVAATCRLALGRMPDHPVLFQGKTMASGDFLATWVVELAVHQLDLGAEAGPPTAGALAAVRRTVEALADVDLPAEWEDEQAALVALGRGPLPDDAGDLAGVLPISI